MTLSNTDLLEIAQRLTESNLMADPQRSITVTTVVEFLKLMAKSTKEDFEKFQQQVASNPERLSSEVL